MTVAAPTKAGFMGVNIARDKAVVQMGVSGDVSISRTGPGEVTIDAKKIIVGGYDLLELLGRLEKLLAPKPKSCAELLLLSKKKPKSGMYTIEGKKMYCDMDSAGGGWTLLTQFGSKDTYGIGSKGVEKIAELKAKGWTTNGKYIDHGYGPKELKSTSMDFHNSGAAVAWIQKKLPSNGNEVRVKYAHYYPGGATLVYVGGKERTRSNKQCKNKNCPIFYQGPYKTGDSLKLDESQGTSVGAIFAVFYRAKVHPNMLASKPKTCKAAMTASDKKID